RAAQHDLRTLVADRVDRMADRLQARDVARREGLGVALVAVRQRELALQRGREPGSGHVRPHAGDAARVQRLQLRLRVPPAAQAVADIDADLLRVEAGARQAALGQRLAGGDHAVHAERVELALQAAAQGARGVEPAQHPQLGLVVELLGDAVAGLARRAAEVGGDGRQVVAQRADRADAGDGNSFVHGWSALITMTLWMPEKPLESFSACRMRDARAWLGT